jgi:phosphate transport system substrate-binding protein
MLTRLPYLRTAAIATVAALAAAAGCGHRADSVTIAGSTSFQAVEKAWADAFNAATGGTPIHIENVDSASAMHALRSGFADIAVAEFVTLPPGTADLKVAPVARDGIAVIVHPDNTVTNLSREAVKGIFYGGTLRVWSQIGGVDQPLNRITRERGSGTRQSMEDLIGATGEGAGGVVLETSRAILESVARDRHAIGYVSHTVVDDRVRQVSIDGVACTPETILAGRYPLVRTLNLLSAATPTGRTQAFIDFVLSPAGRAISARYELTPLP